MALDLRSGELTLFVGGVPWRRLADLEQLGRAGPDEPVFVLDPHAGVVRFGDGVHGRRPPAGASIHGRYRDGNGRAGTVEGTWTGASTALLQPARSRSPLLAVLIVLMLLGLAWLAWRLASH